MSAHAKMPAPESGPDDGGMERPQLQEGMIRELYTMFARFQRRQEQRIAAASAAGEEGLLHYLAYQRDGVTSGFLKDQLGVGSGRMADILRRMEEKEMIARTEDPRDSRRVIVHITERGRRQAERTNERVLAWYRKLLQYLGEEDSRELLRILQKISLFHE